FTLHLKADQTVVGVAINIFASGFTISLNRMIFGASTSPPQIAVFRRVPVPVLKDIPIIGNALFNQPVLCYMAFLLVPVAWYVMQKTHIGLQVRAVGENPKACDSLGINVLKVRWRTIMVSALTAGLGGAFVSMGQLSFFTEEMIAGRGYMVVAAIVFGRYSPVGVMLATLLFGAGDAVMYQIQAANIGIPYQISLMLPYIITVLTVCGLIGKTRTPAASGQVYTKE
ncbi:MAG TPA: ABC transporter permease, partial [Clostridia bacterium]|nr:ABC transporter permease [Clostridia bacterium]